MQMDSYSKPLTFGIWEFANENSKIERTESDVLQVEKRHLCLLTSWINREQHVH